MGGGGVWGEGGHKALYFTAFWQGRRNRPRCGAGKTAVFARNAVFYSVLARSGYFDVNELNTFRLINSRLQGHPTTHEGLPGVRIASGSLGQGLSVAIGAALSKKLNNDNNLVYCLMGDGELQEGQNWEAIMYASSNKVDNIIATVDLNGQQIDGSTEDVLNLGNIKDKSKLQCSLSFNCPNLSQRQVTLLGPLE